VPETPEPELPIEGGRLGEYQVLAPISEGGMASVWLGHPAGRPAQLVALKVIRAEHGRNADFVAMLVDEAAIASRLSHPNVLKTRALGHDGKQHFLVMELLRGHTLRDVWRTAHLAGKRLPVEVVAWIGARVADALHHAHELTDEGGAPLYVVHRDVNPANIFVTSEGVPKLIDFGLARARDRIASTAVGVVKGKLAYLAPEQAQGQTADRRSDVFALGVTLWEITTDRRLFQDEDDVQTIRRVREAEVPDPTTLVEGYPRALADALVRALAKDPAARWQSAAELRDALDAYVRAAGEPVDASTVRALTTQLFADEQPAPWERMADEVAAEQERTRVWEDPKEPRERKAPAPDALPTEVMPALVLPTAEPKVRSMAPQVVAMALACAVVGGLVAGLAVRGCRAQSAAAAPGLEPRVARLEDLLGLGDAGASAPTPGAVAPAAGVVVSLDDRSAPCAVAKVAAYQAWQEAVTRAKSNAGPAEAACAGVWSDTKKQACYRGAMGQIHATQAARDVVIAGGALAREAARAIREDPHNEAIARARAASQAAFAACDDDGGT
jgi:eukaryotic-like serine/threonine-protein kinase